MGTLFLPFCPCRRNIFYDDKTYFKNGQRNSPCRFHKACQAQQSDRSALHHLRISSSLESLLTAVQTVSYRVISSRSHGCRGTWLRLWLLCLESVLSIWRTLCLSCLEDSMRGLGFRLSGSEREVARRPSYAFSWHRTMTIPIAGLARSVIEEREALKSLS